MYRNNKLIILALFLMLGSGSCTKKFEQINVNPNAPASVPLDYEFSQVALYATGTSSDPGHKMWRTSFFTCATLVQQFARLGGGYNGDKYQYDGEASATYWNDSYPASIKNEVDLIERAKKDPTMVNILSMARIIKVFDFHRMTDIYGDVPYFDAGLAYLKQNFTPNYDEQSKIYPDMLKELSEAGAALDATKYTPTAGDMIYAGDVTKWKKFANSLMLRLAMRLQKVDAASAQTWAKKALDGGVMTSGSDDFAIDMYSTSISNPYSYNLGSGRGEVKLGVLQWSKTFIDAMKTRNDPRLGVIATLPPISGGVIDASTEGVDGDRTVANQRGLPNGLDLTNPTNPANDLKTQTGETNLNKFSRPTKLMYDLTERNNVMNYAEVEFLKAEAIERGWYTGSAAAEYALGQAAALQVMAGYKDPTATIAPAAIAAYQAANLYPAGTLAQRVAQIQTELWLLWGTTFNNIEAWSSWRRTGYPVLVQVNYPGNVTGGTIDRRLRYPAGEASYPTYQSAITRLTGGDQLTSRVWWDK
jgi:Starch-binding associating with outer membrane